MAKQFDPLKAEKEQREKHEIAVEEALGGIKGAVHGVEYALNSIESALGRIEGQLGQIKDTLQFAFFVGSVIAAAYIFIDVWQWWSG